MKQKFKIQQSKIKIAIAIAVAIVTVWGGHIYAMTPPTPECPLTVGTRYIASTGVTPASARSCRVQKRSFCLPPQFKIQHSTFKITSVLGGSQSHEQSCDPRRCPQVCTVSSLAVSSFNPCGISVRRITENTINPRVVGSIPNFLQNNYGCRRSSNIWNIPYLRVLHKPLTKGHAVAGASRTYYRPVMGQLCIITNIHTMEWRYRYVHAPKIERYQQRSVGRLERRGIRHLTGKEVTHV